MAITDVCCAIIIKNNKALITQNSSESDHPYEWEFPGGKIKAGETAEACIKREIQEELRVELDIVLPAHLVVFDYGIKKIRLIPFICTVKNGAFTLTEHISSRWISYEELQTVKFSGADRALLEMNENRKILKEYIGEQVDHNR